MDNEYTSEIWVKVEGYDHYEVSSMGRIRSNSKRAGGAIKTMALDSYGYPIAILYKNAVGKTHTIHRLVAKHFIPNPENKLTVNHINGIKTDNRVENLEWNTRSENERHSYRVLGKIPNNTGKEIIMYDENFLALDIFPSAAAASKASGVPKSSVSKIANGEFIMSKNKLRFQYVNR